MPGTGGRYQGDGGWHWGRPPLHAGLNQPVAYRRQIVGIRRGEAAILDVLTAAMKFPKGVKNVVKWTTQHEPINMR